MESVESCGSTNGCGQWIANVANLWRIGADIQANWDSVMSIIDHNNMLWPLAGPGHWNGKPRSPPHRPILSLTACCADPDMLEVGNVGLSFDEQLSHFALWCVMAAPLLIGTDVHSASNNTLAILGAPELIAVDQDKVCCARRKP